MWIYWIKGLTCFPPPPSVAGLASLEGQPHGGGAQVVLEVHVAVVAAAVDADGGVVAVVAADGGVDGAGVERPGD